MLFQPTPVRTTNHSRVAHDVEGFPLTVKAFEDNKAESTAAPPVIRNSQQHIDVNGVAIGVNTGVFSQDNTDGQI